MRRLVWATSICAPLLFAGCSLVGGDVHQDSAVDVNQQDGIATLPRILVVYGGDIITADKDNRVFDHEQGDTGVLIVDDTIAAIGDLESINKHLKGRYPGLNSPVRYLDLAGRTLMPGFVEPHAHLQLTAQTSFVPNLMPCLPDKYQQQLNQDYGWLYYQGKDIPTEQADVRANCYLYVEEAINALSTTKVNSADQWLVGNGLDPSRMLLSKNDNYPFIPNPNNDKDIDARNKLEFGKALNANKQFLNFPMHYIQDPNAFAAKARQQSSNVLATNPVLMLDQSGHLGYANMAAFKQTGLCNKRISKSQIAALKLGDKIDPKVINSDGSVTLSCEASSESEMASYQSIVKAMYFPDGDWAIVKNQGKWQYSGLLKEQSSYGPFVVAIEKSLASGHIDVAGMLKHAGNIKASDKLLCKGDTQNPVMKVMTNILNTSSQQGVTTFVEGGSTTSMVDNYKCIAKSGKAATRIRALYDWQDLHDQQENNNTRSTRYKIPFDSPMYKGMLSAEGVKLWSDGSTQGCSANLSHDYETDGLCEQFHTGHVDFNESQIRDNLQGFADAGWYFNIHANGDAGIKDSIGALRNMNRAPRERSQSECEMSENKKDYACLAHTIIHSTVNSEGGTTNAGVPIVVEEYLAARHTLPNLTPSHLIGHIAYWGRSMENELGEQRGKMIDPMRTELDNDIPFSIHSDLSISALFPIWFIEQAVTRNTWYYPNLEGNGTPLNAQQSVEIMEAIRALTIVPAMQHNIADKLGSIEVNKLADFIVLDKNPLDFNTHQAGKRPVDIHTINVDCAFVGAKLVPWLDLNELSKGKEEYLDSKCNLALKPYN
ncbi:amidohydrolase family protein [Pseudoalteromonas sp. MMG022]|uniref:amidohydrolase family protein n=1 Tax=Pseudoalteromonas sp. MMG022 TaxID=2909978 RepID=UPI001F3E505F|nr:amidohydrolase family protein [Pseudoalteromonas sp. MMG022]MCF6436771.1 amidohydrolase family protein [Pseudoalteromonas sp. MMG022]